MHPGEKPPTLPAVGTTNTAAGARAFAVFYIQALDWGYATMDATLATSLFSDTCRGCARFVKTFFDDEVQLGRHYIGSRTVVTGAESVRSDHHFGSSQVVDTTVTQEKGTLVDSAGKVIEREPAVREAVFRSWLVWSHAHWAIVDWKRVVFK